MNRALQFSTILIGLVALFLIGLWVYDTEANNRQAEPVVVRVYYNSIDEIYQLTNYDLWEYNNVAEKYVLVALDAGQIPAIEAMGFRVLVDDGETAVLTTAAITTQRPFNNGYRTVDELYADMDRLAADHPMLAKIVEYGDSHCLAVDGCETLGGDQLPGYKLRAIRITNQAIPGASIIDNGPIQQGTKPVFFLLANIHAREITTPELAMRMADWLLDGYGENADATWLVDWHEIWIVPTANPDGHWIVELGTQPPYGGTAFFHRKNANNDTNNDGTNDCSLWPAIFPGSHLGVDLNRNHSFAWGPPGSSATPCSGVYRGPEAASENEVALLEALVSSLVPDQRGPNLTDPAPLDTKGIFITIHSFSELVLWPWGYTTIAAPNRNGLKAIGDKLATFNGYTSCQPTICLYGANGTSDDWAYGELGIPSFTFEVGQTFMPPYSNIEQEQWPDNGPAFQYAAKIAAAPYQLVQGPDVTNIGTTTTANMLSISATLNDNANGNQPIAAAAYTLDAPFWADNVTSLPLHAADGAFDAAVETGTAVLDTTDLALGRHTLYIHAQDAAGNWGPVSAHFFDVIAAPPTQPTLYFPFVPNDQ